MREFCPNFARILRECFGAPFPSYFFETCSRPRTTQGGQGKSEIYFFVHLFLVFFEHQIWRCAEAGRSHCRGDPWSFFGVASPTVSEVPWGCRRAIWFWSKSQMDSEIPTSPRSVSSQILCFFLRAPRFSRCPASCLETYSVNEESARTLTLRGQFHPKSLGFSNNAFK